MKIRTFLSLENNVYKAVLTTEDWSERDVKLMEKYGEPEIDVGGAFYNGSTLFELESDYRKIKTESPFARGFDARDYVDAVDMVEAWAGEIKDRITAGVLALRQMDGEYGQEEVVTV